MYRSRPGSGGRSTLTETVSTRVNQQVPVFGERVEARDRSEPRPEENSLPLKRGEGRAEEDAYTVEAVARSQRIGSCGGVAPGHEVAARSVTARGCRLHRPRVGNTADKLSAPRAIRSGDWSFITSFGFQPEEFLRACGLVRHDELIADRHRNVSYRNPIVWRQIRG